MCERQTAGLGMEDLFGDIPAGLRESLDRSWAAFASHTSALEFGDESQERIFYATLGKVWASSPFVAGQCLRRPKALASLVASGHLFTTASASFYRNALNSLLSSVTSEKGLMEVLRRFRNQEMARIAWRDIAGWADLPETCGSHSVGGSMHSRNPGISIPAGLPNAGRPA